MPLGSQGWKLLRSVLKVTVSVGLLVWLLGRADRISIASSLSGADRTWLATALLLSGAATLVQARQWQRLLLAVGLERTITRSLRIVFVGNTFNAVLPSTIGGDAARVMFMARGRGERAAAAVAVVLQRLLNFPGMVLLMSVGLAVTATSPAADRVRPLALLGAVVGLAVLGLALSPVLGRIGESARLSWLPGWSALSTGLRLLDRFRARRAELLAASGRGVVFWLLSILNHWSYMHAVGMRAPLGYAAVAVTLVNGLTMLPISINGYGARESGYLALLAGVGLATTAQAISVGLLVSAQSVLLGLIGVGCLLSLRGPTREVIPAEPEIDGAGRGTAEARHRPRLQQYAVALALLALAAAACVHSLLRGHLDGALQDVLTGR